MFKGKRCFGMNVPQVWDKCSMFLDKCFDVLRQLFQSCRENVRGQNVHGSVLCPNVVFVCLFLN